MGTHMPYEITPCYLPPGRGDIPALAPCYLPPGKNREENVKETERKREQTKQKDREEEKNKIDGR